LSGERLEFSSATQIYDFIHIADVARAFFLLSEYGENGRTYCVGSGSSRPLKEYITQMRDLLDPGAQLIFGGKPGICLDGKYFDIEPLVSDTGFCPGISFKEGVLRLRERWRKTHEN
jgi:nucleoside-diphosphate-sugar epimerase